ncbi:MAG: NAD(P)H-hydrate dehydratase [Gemmatimonadota bacterium]|nr:NAD(P)H-hydrate dehydratase [Gemmatimonadota bacterium]
MTTRFPRSDWWRLAASGVWLPTADEMAAIDRAAVASGAIPERALIENAGRAVALQVHERYPEGRILVLAGSGHNGADAFVAGRTLAAWGRAVDFLRCGSRLPDPDVLAGWDFPVEEPDALDPALARADVVLDGILGTGIDTAPREPQASMIERVNASGVPVVAVDGPSGVDFTTGAVPGTAIRAEMSVTLGWPKVGLLRFPARGRCGDLIAVEIGFPPADPQPAARAVTAAWARTLLGDRPADAHKGQAGYLAILGGRVGMAGAVILACRAALRAGAGIVRVVSAPENREVIQTAVPSAVFVSWEEEEGIADTLAWCDALALGPGLGRGNRGAEIARAALEANDAAAVLDADGLNVWGSDLRALAAFRGPLLLTPHPGEMGRLLGRDTAAVTSEPTAAALRLARDTGAVAMLKGAPTWIASPDERLRATTVLNEVFASGGMGDVLTGACGAYLAAGLPPADAATVALAITAVAAEGCAVGAGSADLPDRIPGARAALAEIRPGAWAGVSLALPAASGSPG